MHMRRLITAIIFTLTLTAGAHAMNDHDAITNLYHEMYTAMTRKDSERLAEILDDSFVLVHMTGMKQAKNDYITAITDGTLNYYTEDTENIRVNVDGNAAALTGQSRVNAAVFGGGRHTWRLQLDISLAKTGGNWRMIHAQASTY